VTSVRFSADGRRALSGSEDRTLRLWDLNSGQCLNVLSGHHHAVNAVAISPDGRFAVSGSGNGFTSAEEDDFTLRLWDLERDRCLRVLSGHTEPVDGVAISADGRYALSGSWDTAVRVWDLTAGVCLRTLEGHTDGVSSVGFSADDAFAVSAGWDETVRVWQLDWALDV
jgi:WD40 repeat protein